MATYGRYGTPSPLGIQNDRELSDLSPTSQDTFYAGSGHIPLNQPFGVSNNYNFPQHNVPPLDGPPSEMPHGAPNSYSYPNPAAPSWQATNAAGGPPMNPNPHHFQQHVPPQNLSHIAAGSPRGHQPSIAATEQPFDLPGGQADDPDDDQLLEEADVHWRAIAKPLRLGRATVMCLIFNRMIGI